MDPFTPNDPLWKLMSKARRAVPRTDFTQKVVRAARQQAQDHGWWPRACHWVAEWQGVLLLGNAAATVVVLTFLILSRGQDSSSVPGVAMNASAAPVMANAGIEMADIADEDFSLPLDSLDHMDALVAREDTSSLTDAEIQFLLY